MGKRMNEEWEIIVAVPLDPGVEVVIGDRHTDFQPYVVWWCYNEKDYRSGDYFQDYKDAAKCLATRIMPTTESFHIVELAGFIEECDAIIPFLSDDEGFGEAKKLYVHDRDFRRKVAEEFGNYWHKYLEDQTSDARFDCVIDALSKACKERRDKDA